MKICILGLWHLGSVTAACLAKLKHEVVGLDFNKKVIYNLHIFFSEQTRAQCRDI